METRFDDDHNLVELASKLKSLTPEQAKQVLDAIVCAKAWVPIGKIKEPFTPAMIYILGVVLDWFKPAWWHYDV